MKISISFTNIGHTKSLDDMIEQKTKKLDKYFKEKMEFRWTCTTKEGRHFSELLVLGPKIKYQAKSFSSSLYKSFDQVVAKLERQIARKKEKWKNHIHRRHESEIKILDPEQAWFGHDDEEFDDVVGS